MKKTIRAIIMALIVSLCLTGCNQLGLNKGNEITEGGVLVLKVNPEIAVEYDEKGIVTGVTARNNDAIKILDSCEGLIGLETREAVANLVNAIGAAGYFVEEVEGEYRKIVLEIESGSQIPSDTFIQELVDAVKNAAKNNDWNVRLDIENESDYGLSDYKDSDYEDDTDYDGVDTDYENDTDYEDNNDSDYDNDSNYNSNTSTKNSSSSSDTDYSDYDDSDYDDSDYD
ncbi:MAG: anti-sigma-I factor RsgI family protein [Erysipelotrichaceae bacterium]|jgi:hypothetical protein